MKPTPGAWGKYRELQILEELDGKGNVSQRRLAELVGASPGTVNRHLRRMVEEGLLRVVDRGVRPYAYRLTDQGRRRRRRLAHRHYRSVLMEVQEMKARIGSRLRELKANGADRVVFYGAGAVMEAAWPLAREAGLEVVAVVDDDPEKQGERVESVTVRAPETIEGLEADAVVITSLLHAGEIRSRLELEPEATLEVCEL